MFEFIKRNKITVIILIATIALGGIAIFTATRLYSLRDQRVAPNAPESAPAAATPALTNTCDLTFSLTAVSEGALCDEPCTTDSDCIEINQSCYDTDSDGTDDSCRLIAYPEEATCEIPVAGCDEPCTTDTECTGEGQTCVDTDSDTVDDSCRLTDYPEEADCNPPEDDVVIECNDICTSDSECEGSLECISSICRNSECSDESDCECPSATATPTPTATPTGGTSAPVTNLPDAGVGLPTIIGISTATLLFMGALLLAL